ncbi:hypothetical protein, partial [Klebsiella pneumoniae]|uniref:hypothetical protein n=1 Tax=Klebsiella pneumoniae TaxID=573 RepID=UPI002730091F
DADGNNDFYCDGDDCPKYAYRHHAEAACGSAYIGDNISGIQVLLFFIGVSKDFINDRLVYCGIAFCEYPG